MDEPFSPPPLSPDDWLRIREALRYLGRDLHHRSFAVQAERRELLWQEMDACLALADRLSPAAREEPVAEPAGAAPGIPCTLVTGASSGIGAALARRLAPELAREGEPLVLTARRLDRLEALAGELRGAQAGLSVEVIPADLARPGAATALLAELEQRGLEVRTLVNNAGFGLRGAFGDQAWPEAETMLQVLVVAATELCRGVLPAMRRAGEGRILNVASLAGLIPSLPGSTLYAASKAYLVRLSQSLAAESGSQGIRVVALCPGYVRTEFHAVLGVEERMRRQLPGPLWMKADALALQALRALEGDRVVVVPGRLNQLLAALARWLPEPCVTALSGRFSRRYRG
ncbi:MAG: SDR family NAD(P)-dependent oxidoreductase [Synechococcus sp.]|nr:SDR family NAD(P)-dependent oxidoreductase [Synechococcus sp.]